MYGVVEGNWLERETGGVREKEREECGSGGREGEENKRPHGPGAGVGPRLPLTAWRVSVVVGE